MPIPSPFRHPDGAIPNLLAMTWALGGWTGGVILICRGPGAAAAAGVVLLAHAMVVASYLLHEFAHHTVFRKPAANQAAGRLASWIAGSCYAPYAELRAKHMRHHVDRADVVGFDYRAFLRRRPALRAAVAALEWAYVPAVDLLMHAAVLVLPMSRLLRPYHRHRVARLLAEDYGVVGRGPRAAEDFLGAVGVSFLTSV